MNRKGHKETHFQLFVYQLFFWCVRGTTFVVNNPLARLSNPQNPMCRMAAHSAVVRTIFHKSICAVFLGCKVRFININYYNTDKKDDIFPHTYSSAMMGVRRILAALLLITSSSGVLSREFDL